MEQKENQEKPKDFDKALAKAAEIINSLCPKCKKAKNVVMLCKDCRKKLLQIRKIKKL